MITDEMVEAVVRALIIEQACGMLNVEAHLPCPRDELCSCRREAKAVLEAIAPMIRAAALEEAERAQPCTAWNPSDSSDREHGHFEGVMEYRAAIRALKEQKP
jgi:pyruvate/2-oxoacid:ferredoxin oxidoreductase beta subunit